MSRLPPPFWPSHRVASESAPDTLRSAPPDLELGRELELGERDTIAVPLASADTLPCPRLDLDELPTLRAAPAELAALIRLTRPTRPQGRDEVATALPVPCPSARSQAAWPPHSAAPLHPAHRTPAVRQADSGPTQPLRRALPGDATLPVLAVTQPPQRPLGLQRLQQPAPAAYSPHAPVPAARLSHSSAYAARSSYVPAPAAHSPHALAPARASGGGGEMIPTQLWFAPVRPLVTLARSARQSWWQRLRCLLGLATPDRRQMPAGYLGAYRQPIMRRE